MRNNRRVKALVAVGIVVMALLSLGTAVSGQRVTSATDDKRAAVLDWYFAHDHAVLDGDNSVVSSEANAMSSGLAPLDWYFAHDHAVLDGENNVLSSDTDPLDNRLSPLDWYLNHQHAVPDSE